MPQYQKAYLLKDLRRFPGWTETRLRQEPAELTDESVVYVQEDLTVRESCFDTSSALFAEVTPGWERFCRDELKFAVPDWEEESRLVREALARRESGSSEPADAPGSNTG